MLADVDRVAVLQERDAVEADEHGDGHARDDGDGLQRLERGVVDFALLEVGHHEHDCGRALGQRPVDFLQRRAFHGAIGGVAVDDVRAGVRTGHEVEGEHDDGGPGERHVDCFAVTLELREPHRRGAVAAHVHHVLGLNRVLRRDVLAPFLVESDLKRFPGDFLLGAGDASHGGLAVALDADGAEHVEPEEHLDDRRDDGRSDELADGAAAGDLGDEGTDERRPGDPPAPLEDGPAVHEALVVHLRRTGLDLLHRVGVGASVLGPDAWLLWDAHREAVGAPAEFDEVLHVVEGDFDEAVEALLPVVHEEDGEQEYVAEQEREFSQSADAVLHTGDD